MGLIPVSTSAGAARVARVPRKVGFLVLCLAQRAGVVASLLLLPGLVGCQVNQQAVTRRIIDSQVWIDFSGLKSRETVDAVQMSCATPRKWERMPLKQTALYSHQQWRSPSGRTGVGAAYVHLPLPISADAVLWLAKAEYAKKGDDGRLLRQWTDEQGRSWFEAENRKYHVFGYALAQGFDAWLIYVGYRTDEPPDMAEVALGKTSADTFVPRSAGRLPATRPADATEKR